MNATTLTVNQLCGAFTAPNGRFRSLSSVKKFLFCLNVDMPVARSLIGRLRDHAKGGAFLSTWLDETLKRLEAFAGKMELKRRADKERQRNQDNYIAWLAAAPRLKDQPTVNDGDVVRSEVFDGRRGDLSCQEWAAT